MSRMKLSAYNSIGQINVLTTNSRERRRLEGQLKDLHSSTKYRVDKIDREMMILKRQLEEDRKIVGTHCDISRQNGCEATITVSKIVSMELPGRGGRQGRRHSIASPMEMAPKLTRSSHDIQHDVINTRKPKTMLSAFPTSQEWKRTNSKEVLNRSGKGHMIQRRRHSIASPEIMADKPSTVFCSETDNDTKRHLNVSTSIGNRVVASQERKTHEKVSGIFKDTKTDIPGKKLFQRRNSMPSFGFTNIKGNNKKEVLTAKLPTRISSAKPHIAQRQFLQQSNPRSVKQPTPVSEHTEVSDDESSKSDSQNTKEEKSLQEEVCLSEEEDSIPKELLILPKITLEEKIDKYFSESIENTSTTLGPFEEVLEQLKTNDNIINGIEKYDKI